MDSETVRRYFERVTDQTAFYDWIGLRPVRVEEGRVVGEIPDDETLMTPSPPGAGSVHGGVIATLVDMTAVGAVVSTMSDPRDAFVSTTEIQIEFIEPVRQGLQAEAVVVDSDDRTAEVSVTVSRGSSKSESQAETEAARETVATGDVVCRISETAVTADRL